MTTDKIKKAASSAVEKPAAKPSANEGPTLDFGSAWEYAPAPEATDSVKIKPRYELFVDGKWQAPASKKYFDTISPSTEVKLSEVAEANEADVDGAVKAARKAYEKVWSKMPAAERGKYIYRIALRIQERARELAIVETIGRRQAHQGIARRRRAPLLCWPPCTT